MKTTTHPIAASANKNLKSNFLFRKTFLFIFTLFFAQVASAQWTQVGNDIDGEAAGDLFGYSVSMPTANTVAISGIENNGNGLEAGHTRVFLWTGNRWFQKGSDIDGETSGDLSGGSICMPDINTIAIGASRNNANGSLSGHVRIFGWTGSAWVQKGNDIDGEAAGDYSGASISMPDTNTIAIGAPSNSGNGSKAGHVRVYYWSGNAWLQKGNDIDGEAANDRSGTSVSMPNSNTVAIGAPNNNWTGHVRIYQWSGSSWTPKGNDIDGEAFGDRSGTSVSMPDSNTIAIGAPFNNNTGDVRIYQWSGSSWTPKGNDIVGTNIFYDDFGYSVSMPDANTVAIGARFSNVTGTNAGETTVYQWSGSTWTQLGSHINGVASEDRFGESVSMPSSNTVAIGAIGNDGNGPEAGHVRVYSFGSISTGVQDSKNKSSSFNLFPNPTKGNFRLELGQLEENKLLQVFDLQGKLIHQQKVSQLTEKINTKNWKAGVYFVRYGEQMKKLVILE